MAEKYILDGNDILWQYDIGRQLIKPDINSYDYETHFYSKNHKEIDTSKSEKVTIPEKILQDAGQFDVYAYKKTGIGSTVTAQTLVHTTFTVRERPASPQ